MVAGTREELFGPDKKYEKWPEDEVIEISLEGKALTEAEIAQLVKILENKNFSLRLKDYPSNVEIPAALVNVIEASSQKINKTEKKEESGLEALDEGMKALNETFWTLGGFNEEDEFEKFGPVTSSEKLKENFRDLEEKKEIRKEDIGEIENSIPNQERAEWTEDDDIEFDLVNLPKSKKFDDQQKEIPEKTVKMAEDENINIIDNPDTVTSLSEKIGEDWEEDEEYEDDLDLLEDSIEDEEAVPHEIDNVKIEQENKVVTPPPAASPEKYKYTTVKDLVELSKRDFQHSDYYGEKIRSESEKQIITAESKLTTAKQVDKLSQKIASKTQEERAKLATNKEEREKLVEELLIENKDKKNELEKQLKTIEIDTKEKLTEKIKELEADEGKAEKLIDELVRKLIQNPSNESLRELKEIQKSKKELLEEQETYQDAKNIFWMKLKLAEGSSNELRDKIAEKRKGTLTYEQKEKLKDALLENENSQEELLKQLEKVEEVSHTLNYQVRMKSQGGLTEGKIGEINQLKNDLLKNEALKDSLQESLNKVQKLNNELKDEIEKNSQARLTGDEIENITTLLENLAANEELEKGFVEKIEALEKNEKSRDNLLKELTIDRKEGCDIYLMSSFPESELEQYKNSYIVVDNNVKYVTVNSQYQQVTIDNPEQFSNAIGLFNHEKKNKLHLKDDEVNYLITLNGGHTRENKDLTKNKTEIRELLRHKKQLNTLKKTLNAEKKGIEKQKEPIEKMLENNKIEGEQLELSKNEMEKVVRKLAERVEYGLTTDIAGNNEKLKNEPLKQIEISLEDQFLTKKDVKLLASILKDKDFNLEVLRLKNCNLDDEDAKILMDALKSRPRYMQVLDLSGNKISDNAVKEIAGVLSEVNIKQINQVVLNDTQVGDEGIKELAGAVRDNRGKVKTLNCEGSNKFTIEGTKSLIDDLEKYIDPHRQWSERFFEFHANVATHNPQQSEELASNLQHLKRSPTDAAPIVGVSPEQRFYQEWRKAGCNLHLNFCYDTLPEKEELEIPTLVKLFNTKTHQNEFYIYDISKDGAEFNKLDYEENDSLAKLREFTVNLQEMKIKKEELTGFKKQLKTLGNELKILKSSDAKEKLSILPSKNLDDIDEEFKNELKDRLEYFTNKLDNLKLEKLVDFKEGIKILAGDLKKLKGKDLAGFKEDLETLENKLNSFKENNLVQIKNELEDLGNKDLVNFKTELKAFTVKLKDFDDKKLGDLKEELNVFSNELADFKDKELATFRKDIKALAIHEGNSLSGELSNLKFDRSTLFVSPGENAEIYNLLKATHPTLSAQSATSLSLPEKLDKKLDFLAEKYPENTEIKELVDELRGISQELQKNVDEQVNQATANSKHALTSKQAEGILSSSPMVILRATDKMLGGLLKENENLDQNLKVLKEYVNEYREAILQATKKVEKSGNLADNKAIGADSKAPNNQQKAKAGWLATIKKILGRVLRCMPVFCPDAGKFRALINRTAQNNPVRTLYLLMKERKEKSVPKLLAEEKETLSLPKKLEKKINSLSEKYPMDEKFQELTSTLKAFVNNIQHSFTSGFSKDEKTSQNPALATLEATDEMVGKLLAKPEDPTALVTAVNQYSHAVNHAADKQGGEQGKFLKNEAKTIISCVLACLPKICPPIAKFMSAVNAFIKSDPMHALYLLAKKVKSTLSMEPSHTVTSASPNNRSLFSIFKSGKTSEGSSLEDKNSVELSVISKPASPSSR